MSKLQELTDARVQLIHEAREKLNSLADETPEGERAEIEARFDEMMVDADKMKSQIDREVRLGEQEKSLDEVIERRAGRDNIPSGERAKSKWEAEDEQISEDRAFEKWVRYGLGNLESEERSVLQSINKRALETGSNTSGGFTVPTGFRNVLEEALLEYGGMREVATLISTDSGNDLPMPTVNDTAQKGAIYAENATIAAQDVAFGSVTLQAFKYSSKVVKVSWELLQDSAFNLQGFLSNALATRIARITNEHFTTGTGTGEPDGVVNDAIAGKTATATNAIVASELFDLVASVDPAYRRNARFMMADTYLTHLKKLTVGTTDDRPLWMPSLVPGAPDTILGHGYTINQDMASGLTTGTIGVLFGELSKYMIRDVADVRLVRLDERYADQGQVGFLSWSRHDGALLDAGTNPVKWLELA